jgi:hypothetical protein
MFFRNPAIENQAYLDSLKEVMNWVNIMLLSCAEPYNKKWHLQLSNNNLFVV